MFSRRIVRPASIYFIIHPNSRLCFSFIFSHKCSHSRTLSISSSLLPAASYLLLLFVFVHLFEDVRVCVCLIRSVCLIAIQQSQVPQTNGILNLSNQRQFDNQADGFNAIYLWHYWCVV